MELRGAHNAPRDLALLHHPLLVSLDPEVAHRDLAGSDDRHADVMPDSRGLFGGEQPPGSFDQRLRRSLGRRVVARIDDHVAAVQGAAEALSCGQVNPVLRGAAAEHPDLMPACP
jgi:hypothetical protein